MSERRARFLGMLVQGLVVGALLCAAIYQIAMLSSEARIFRYQNF